MLSDFTKLNTFLTVVKEKSFSKASAKLGISQPAVTQQMRFIEDYLDTKIVERKKNGIILLYKGSNVIEELIKKDIKLISMHTNYDKTCLNSYVAREILGFDKIECEEFVCYFDVNDTFESFSRLVKNRLNLQYLKKVKGKDFIKKAALTTGSGAQLLDKINADCFLTGDIKYHDAMEAKSLNLSLIDIGHYESEHYFGKVMMELCEKYLQKNISKSY